MAATDKILRNSAGRLEVFFYEDGVLVDEDSNTVTVTVTDALGNVLVTNDSTTRVGVGHYRWVLPAQDDLNEFTIKWSGTFQGIDQTVTTYADVVGQHLYTVQGARAFGKSNHLEDDVKYPAEEIIETREEITEMFEKFCRVSFVPKFGKTTQDGDGTDTLYLPHTRTTKLLSVTIGGTSIATTGFTLSQDGRLHYGNGIFTKDEQNVVVTYEHGYEHPPAGVARAALLMTQALLVGTDIMDRSISHTDETGTYRLSYPDMQRDRPTGIPYVDATLHHYVETWGVA